MERASFIFSISDITISEKKKLIRSELSKQILNEMRTMIKLPSTPYVPYISKASQHELM